MTAMRQKIAIIGTGITGLAAAYLLHPQHDITVFEKENRLGGHSNTIDLGNGVGVDSGFIVYNHWTYPNLLRLFAHLEVPTQDSNMSFAVSIDGGRVQYAGGGIGEIFAQKRNLLSRSFWRMLWDLARFYKATPRWLREHPDSTLSLGDYLRQNRYSAVFITQHLLPMAAAIWSTPDQRMLDFPATSFIRFCVNHGLLNFINRPVWRTVTGGSRAYVARVTAPYAERIHRGEAVRTVTRHADHVSVATDTATYRFDQVVIAAHADEAHTMITDKTRDEDAILGAFRYSDNVAYVHRDAALMPPLKKIWSSWNYLTEGTVAQPRLMLTYWMNRLQSFLPENDPIFVTLNPVTLPRAERMITSVVYQHPQFDLGALRAQQRLHTIQGVNRTWFCGAYTGYGFHEDGLASGIAVAEALGATVPWQRPEQEASPARRHTIGPKI